MQKKSVADYIAQCRLGVRFVKLVSSRDGMENILVVTDHFTKSARVYPIWNQIACTTAKVLFNNFFVHYGFPCWQHNGQATNFESRKL